MFQLIILITSIFLIHPDYSAAEGTRTAANHKCESVFSQSVELPKLSQQRLKLWSEMSLKDFAVDVSRLYKFNSFPVKNKRLTWQGPQLPPFLKGSMMPFEGQIDRKDSPLSPLTPFEKLLTLQLQVIDGNMRLKYDQLVENGPLFRELDFLEQQLTAGSSASVNDIQETLGRIEIGLKNLTTLALPEAEYAAESVTNSLGVSENGWPSGSLPLSSGQLSQLFIQQVSTNFEVNDDELQFVAAAYQRFLIEFESRVWRELVKVSQATTKGVLLLLVRIPLNELKELNDLNELQQKGLNFISAYRGMLETNFTRTFYNP